MCVLFTTTFYYYYYYLFTSECVLLFIIDYWQFNDYLIFNI
jgi:hypothetical protein